MLSYEEALEKLLDQIPKPVPIRVPLREALGRVLAAPVLADSDLPPFKKSFVDGFAVRSQDAVQAPVKLEVVGMIAAGDSDQPRLESGQAVQIMTGAALPEEADAVQMVEKTHRVSESEVELLEPVAPAENVAARGSEVQMGETVLARDRVVGAAEAGVTNSWQWSKDQPSARFEIPMPTPYGLNANAWGWMQRSCRRFPMTPIRCAEASRWA